jgi:hypothetical protein
VLQKTPAPAGSANSSLSAVACATADSCMAVGGSTTSAGGGAALAERWSGGPWTIEPVPAPTGATFTSLGTYGGVSCVSSTNCTAVGRFNLQDGLNQALIEQWQGQAWVVEPGATITGGTELALNAVSCAPTAACTAVGGYTNQQHHPVTLAEHA